MDDDWSEVTRRVAEDGRMRAHLLLVVGKLLDYHLLLGLAAGGFGLEAARFEVVDPLTQEGVGDFEALLTVDQTRLCDLAYEDLRVEQAFQQAVLLFELDLFLREEETQLLMGECKVAELALFIEDLDDELEIEAKLLLRGKMGLAVAGLRLIIILNFELKRALHQILQHWLRLKLFRQRLGHEMKQVNGKVGKGKQLIVFYGGSG